MILLVYAHPHPGRSVANRTLIDAVRSLPGLELRSLYECYPDFSIDVQAERALLESARLVIWQHPLYWYSVPALLKLWFESVLGRGWAYGEGVRALAGKDCMWVATTGGRETDYSPQGQHGRPFADFVAPLEQTARFCGMNWLDPLIVHGARLSEGGRLQAQAETYRRRLQEWGDGHG
jgi:glutathione-regulated potassium-efflux system ancillary protein KefF